MLQAQILNNKISPKKQQFLRESGDFQPINKKVILVSIHCISTILTSYRYKTLSSFIKIAPNGKFICNRDFTP